MQPSRLRVGVGIDTVRIGSLEVSRLILGGNPLSGSSHMGAEMDLAMKRYFTSVRIKELYAQAESLGVTTHIARVDHHIMRLLLEYWDEGGAIQWIAQISPVLGEPERGLRNALGSGAKAAFIHGGIMDHYYLHDRLDEVAPLIARIHDAGLPAGVAAHLPETLEWAESNLECDFYLCSYYNPNPRDETPEHLVGQQEKFDSRDRDRMTAAVRHLSKPAVHYKVLAAGRTDPADAFAYVAKHLRPGDSVCVGVYPKDHPTQLADDVRLFSNILNGVRDR